MDNVYTELDSAKAEVEKLKAECRLKTQLFDGLKRDRAEEFLKFQETKKLAEVQARELDLKSEEIHELKKILEDLKSSLHEKEAHVAHLSSENKKIQASSTDRLLELEGSNRELVLALVEVRATNGSLEQNACASSNEISSLKELLLAAEKKCSDAEEKAQQATMLKRRDDVILQLEEENISMKDKIKWRNEQFKHLEEAHEKLQVEFRLSKEEWNKERSLLLEEMSSLQISLDSQTRNVEGLQSRLEMCNHALAHEESRRKLLEVEFSEFKSSFENVFTQYEEKKSEIQLLTILRNDKIAQMRNSLGEKEMVVRELERKIVQLEQDNKELGDLLKELREAQINNGGANSVTSKLRNKLRRLEEANENLLCIVKDQERKTEDLLLQIGLLERCNAEKMKEAERCKQENEGLIQIVEERECCIKDLHKDIAISCLKQESMEKELEDAIHAQLDAEKALKQEKEILLKIKDVKDRTIEHLQGLATASEQDLLGALCFSFSKQVEKWIEVSVLRDALKNAEYLAKLEIEEKNTRIVKSEESIFHLKQEAEQLQASLEALKFENEKLTDKQQAMEFMITELKFENGNLLQDIMNLSTEREDMLVHFEVIFGRIGELSSGDMQLMEMLGNVLNTSEDENEIAMGSVVCDKPHESARDSANDLLFPPTTKKTEENFDGRSPLREVNSLHM
ncbi:hypothetical protein JHK84_041765 [Glycine max]|nr:hypothetical protein JHK85_042162 [Glycine max]KAG5115652.1 hypothetical protein JHK84_041765 [Glycine max]